MPITNADIARIFNHIADLLEIDGDNPFRVRAYRNAARTISDQPQGMAEMLEDGKDLSQLPGIGKDLAGKVAEIVASDRLEMLRTLEAKVPPDLCELLRLTGLGPKRIAVLYRQLGIKTFDELAAAARDQRIRELPGFGKKTEENILREIKGKTAMALRTRLAEAEQVAEPLQAYLKATEGVKQVMVAGSYRRRLETVGDLDILVACERGSPVMDRFTDFENVVEVLAKGGTKSSVRLRGGLQVDLRVVPAVSYGAALYYFTGSKAHNIAVRQIAQRKGLKINEYGVFRGEGEAEERIAGTSEEEVFATVDLPYIEPELRENSGEIEAAREDRLPELIVPGDLRGDLHAHTRATDGRSSLKEMAEAARSLGYSYLAITEHSQAVAMARGFDARRLEQQIEEIDELNEVLSGFRVLKGIEVDILEDGSLDLPDEVLEKLDLTVCAIHSKFDLTLEKQTERIIRAMDNPHFRILAHPTGRLINKREPYQVNMEKIMKAALERGCFMEINAQPDRLDLNDQHCRLAKEMGLKVAICTDSHHTAGLRNVKYGIYQARRGWLTRDDVINTREVEDLLKLLQR
ncbi:MAG: DNA polymerase/3'-5' exonuclease PolX [Syntrophotaleaceae bacterium]